MARRVMMLLAIASLGVLTLAFAGCGGDNKSASETTTATTEATTTETTTTETTPTETTSTDTTATTDTSGSTDFASAKNCQEFAQIQAKMSGALTGSTNVQDLKDAFDQLTAAAPAEIKDDFQTLSDYITQVADAVGNLKAGETPSADALAKLQSIDTTKATQAGQNIGAWTAKNCGGTTPTTTTP